MTYKIINNHESGTDGKTTKEDFLRGLDKDKEIENWFYIGNNKKQQEMLDYNLKRLKCRISNVQKTCICTHNIKKNYYIVNYGLEEIRVIGCSCVKRIFGVLRGKCIDCEEPIVSTSENSRCNECNKRICTDCGCKFNTNKNNKKCVDCRKDKCKDCSLHFTSKIYTVCTLCKKNYNKYNKDLIIKKNKVMYLDINYNDKDIAKKEGAKYDKKNNKWYTTNVEVMRSIENKLKKMENYKKSRVIDEDEF